MTTSGSFVHLHNHSEYSLLDGAQTTKQMAQRAAAIGTPAIALTDHGRMGGLLSFYAECRDAGVKPILGMEAYITGFGRSRKDRTNYQQLTKPFQGTPKYERNNYHLILLCKDYRGYENLCALSKESYESGYYYKPRIDYEVLAKYHEGLIASSACIIGTISNLLLNHDYDKAKQVASWFKETFGDDYYLEVMNHDLDIELQVMQDIRNLGRELDIPVVATNDAHYTTRADHDLQKTLMLIGMHKSWADSDVSGEYFKPGTTEPFDKKEYQEGIADSDSGETDPIFETEPELYLKDYREMLAALRPNGGDNGVAERELAVTLDIAEKCNCELPIIDPADVNAYKMPVYDVPKDIQYPEYEKSGYEIPQHTKDVIIADMRKHGKEGNELEDFMTPHAIESLRFELWLCEKGLKNRVLPKIRMRGEPLPMSAWVDNPPEGLHVNHAHNSPDETWLKGLLAEGKTEEDIIKMYRDRLDQELRVIVGKNFLDYFALTQQYANYTRIKGSQIGPARGSGAGSLLNYLIGITSLDPLPSNLMFERFLNESRRGAPDIDLDFQHTFRDSILWPYLRETYGKDATAQVATYNVFQGKAALKAAGRVLFHKPESIDIPEQLCNLIDDKPKLDLNEVLNEDDSPELMEVIRGSIKAQQVVKLALRLQGRISGESQHASAYIIAPEPIVDKMPLMISKDERELTQKSGKAADNYIIQYDGREVQDKLGYIKEDLLVISDLDVLKVSLDIIERVYGCRIDVENIPLDDKSVFEMVAEGKNRGIFQFDGSSTAIRIIKDSKANSISDWSSVNALNRPGPLGLNFDRKFVEGKLHPESIEYFTPAAEPYLKETYGVCVTQEQLMRMSQDKRIVGFTGVEADNMRKILAHKDQAKIQGIVDLAHERAAANGVPTKVVDTFCDIAKAAGRYSFNSSHAMAYALIAYRGAFLKAHFPEAFLAALCQIKPKMKKKDKIPDYLEDARQLGVTVRPPHVNWSRAAFDVPERHVIAYGLNRIPNVGAAADLIVAEREKNGPFTSITDFCCRVPRAVTKGAIHFLIDAGALDGLGWTRMALEDSLDYLVEFRKGWFDDQEAREKRFDLSAMSDDDGTLDLFGGAPSQASDPNGDASAQPSGHASETPAGAAMAPSDGTGGGTPARTRTDATAPQGASGTASVGITADPAAAFVPDRKSGDPFWAVPPRTPVIDHGVTIQPPHDREYTSRALVRKQFEAFGMYFDGSPEDYTQVSRRFMDDELARQHAAERREGREQYRLVNISDIDRLPDKTRVEFTARIDAVPDRRHRDASGKPTMMSFRPYKSGKGATVFLVDWGVAEESRFGFSPTSYRMSLKCSSRVWDKMPTPQQDQIVHVRGSVSKDPEGKWPTGVWCDHMEMLDDDATFSRGNEATAAEVQAEISRDRERLGRPDSDAYLIPRLTFGSEDALEGFVRDPEVTMRYEDLHGRVLLSVAGDAEGKFDRMRNLRQTRGMVAYAVQAHGAKVDKVLLPKAKAEADRRF